MTQLLKLFSAMPACLIALTVTNILLILGFSVGKIALHKFPNAVKFFAYFSVVTSAILVLYFASILWFAVVCLLNGAYVYTAVIPLFIFAPFVIGHFTSYEKVHFYTNIQILTLFVSLILALSYIYKGI